MSRIAIFMPGMPGWMDKADRDLEVPPDHKGWLHGRRQHQQAPGAPPWHLDDEKLLYPFYAGSWCAPAATSPAWPTQRAQGPVPAPGDRALPQRVFYADVRDEGGPDWPQPNFIIYHWPSASWAAQGLRRLAPVRADRAHRLGDRPAEIPQRHGVGNVYGDLGQIFRAEHGGRTALVRGHDGHLIMGAGRRPRGLGHLAHVDRRPPVADRGRIRRLGDPRGVQKPRWLRAAGGGRRAAKSAIFGTNWRGCTASARSSAVRWPTTAFSRPRPTTTAPAAAAPTRYGCCGAASRLSRLAQELDALLHAGSWARASRTRCPPRCSPGSPGASGRASSTSKRPSGVVVVGQPHDLPRPRSGWPRDSGVWSAVPATGARGISKCAGEPRHAARIAHRGQSGDAHGLELHPRPAWELLRAWPTRVRVARAWPCSTRIRHVSRMLRTVSLESPFPATVAATITIRRVVAHVLELTERGQVRGGPCASTVDSQPMGRGTQDRKG